MTAEQVSEILKLKRIPLTPKMAFNHYFLAMVMKILGCICLYLFIWNDLIEGEYFPLILALHFIIPALYIFLFLGKKQLKLNKIKTRYLDNKTAFILSKATFNCLNWKIIQEIADVYVVALRQYHLGGVPIERGAQAISVFIENGEIFIISLYYPTTQSEFFRNHKKNIYFFEKKLNELDLSQVLLPEIN
jgi:hypothetical protein